MSYHKPRNYTLLAVGDDITNPCACRYIGLALAMSSALAIGMSFFPYSVDGVVQLPANKFTCRHQFRHHQKGLSQLSSIKPPRKLPTFMSLIRVTLGFNASRGETWI